MIKDNKAYQSFKIKALHSYMDFKPIIEAQNRAFLERIEYGTSTKTKTA
jgi:hypothetical protein